MEIPLPLCFGQVSGFSSTFTLRAGSTADGAGGPDPLKEPESGASGDIWRHLRAMAEAMEAEP